MQGIRGEGIILRMVLAGPWHSKIREELARRSFPRTLHTHAHPRNRVEFLLQMNQLIVISAIGRDRPGIVHELTHVVLECGGNILESRMTALGSEFAMLLLVSGSWHTPARLEAALDKLASANKLSVTVRQTREKEPSRDQLPYAVDVVCLDQAGIVYNLANFFTSREIDISELTTRSYAAAHTGAPMFAVQMNINIPQDLQISVLREDFMEFCDQMNLDAIIEPIKT